MKTLNQFKKEQSIEKIELLQGKGRKYCTVRNLSIIVSKKCDLAKPLFVIELSKPVDEAQPDGARVVVPDAFVIINATTVKAVETI